ncbi:MAG: phage antirepressor KilAC domain-containing protein [Eubacteriales bacterium]
MNNPVRILAQTSMPLAQNVVAEELVTTKELAQMLGVEVTAIKRAVQKLGAVLHRVERNNQGGYLFTEKQATLIKQEIQKHHNLATRQIDSVSTEYEENQTIANAMMILQRRTEELKTRMEIAETALNRIADGTGCFSMNQTAKALKLPYGNIKLYERLRGEGILNADNSPKQEQVNAGHFKVVVKFVNEKIGNKPVTLTTGRGLVYLAKRFNTQIDESVRADEQ